jgi:hypothetical protein
MCSAFPCCFFSLYFFQPDFCMISCSPPPPFHRLLIAINWFDAIIKQNTLYVNLGLTSKIFSTVNQITNENSKIQGNSSVRMILSQFNPVHTLTIPFILFYPPSLSRLPNRQVFPPNFCTHILFFPFELQVQIKTLRTYSDGGLWSKPFDLGLRRRWVAVFMPRPHRRLSESP